MRKLALILMLVSSTAVANDCRMQETSQMISQRKVGEVLNLSKNKSHNRCEVKYQIDVDGRRHSVQWTQTGLYQEEILCQMAVRNGTNDLLVRLPGVFKTETLIACKEKVYPKSISKGYEGEESEFGPHPMAPGYRRIGSASNCRFFIGWTAGGNSERTEGVICENKSNLWTVVDKF